MKIVKVSEAPIKETPRKLDVRELYHKDTAQAVHLKLNPGEHLNPHKTTVDVFFYVLEGTAEILVGKEKMLVEKDSLVDSPKNITHCIYNNSDKLVRVLVVKAPMPIKALKSI